ncbi:hypothetical protein M409DRAFT_26800 [Zasmidium cellare ATCC 36951]|uniref:Carboxylic ester hydrolase n=1 Tax=Zasmidium cellare ATCC 36951 TaxID=1080233 RepID=A0A6A6C6Z1_ZASCE|nr:uncharacterized protein M409DRAFT_26800 [Zasmidium cellare ATCC 36951]KAF2162947.1 hypothetical protein M409DRAFT_26800 [Zasmidium cellare ATCC 36951]
MTSLKRMTILGFAFANSLTTTYAAPRSHCSEDTLVVDTTSGKFRPLLDPVYPDVAQYLGIPFAAPPLDDLRFAAPTSPTKRIGISNATKYSAACYQFIPPTQNEFDVYEPGYDYNGTQSEDCLTLNIAGPPSNKSFEPLPVLIFLYGGGFAQGASNVTFQKPPGWVQAKQNLIIVNIQYRLEIFGFPNSAGLEEQNLGLRDIRFAIEWVSDNVAAFGGDPARMALWGQSAGSVATDMYPYSSYADPIVKGNISSSGSVFAPPSFLSFDFAQKNFTYIANKLNCSGDTQQLLACMRTIPASVLNDIAHQYEANTTFLPIPDQTLVFANYTQQLLQGKIANLTAIIGTNRNEGERQLDRNLDPNGPNRTQAEQYTIENFVCPAAIEAKSRHAIGLPTYRYEYIGNFTNLSPLSWMGAYHGSHILMLFGTSGSKEGHPLTGMSTPFQLGLASYMQDMWRAFAYDPTSLVAYGWPLNIDGSGNATNAVKLFPGENGGFSSIESGAAGEQSCSELNA